MRTFMVEIEVRMPPLAAEPRLGFRERLEAHLRPYKARSATAPTGVSLRLMVRGMDAAMATREAALAIQRAFLAEGWGEPVTENVIALPI